MTEVRWAHSSIGDQPEVTLEAVQRGLTVSLIATRRSDFVTCARNENIAAVVERSRTQQFDFLPVTEPKSDRIVGLLELSGFMNGRQPEGDVASATRGLSEENLIGADASILSFVREADTHRCRLVVSGATISGLVTLSDLQRLPVRAALSGLVMYLELVMAMLIKQHHESAESWLALLNNGRRDRLLTEIQAAKASDALVDDLLFTFFRDKVRILSRGSFQAAKRGEFAGDMGEIRWLRNLIAHANDYAASPKAATRTCRTVRLIDKWATLMLDRAGRSAPAEGS